MKRFAGLLSLFVAIAAQADYLGSFKIDDYLFESVTLHRFSSGAAYDATGDVHMRVYELGNAVQIIDDNDLAKFDTTTGLYASLTKLKAATGFEAGKMYTCVIAATVDGIAAIHKDTFQILAPVDVQTVLTAAPATMTDMRGAVRYQNEAAVTPADCNANSLLLMAYDLLHALTSQPTTTVAGVTDAGTFTLTAGSTVDDWYNQAEIAVEDVSDSNRRIKRIIRDYIGASKTIKTDQAFPFLPAVGDPVYIDTNRAVGRGRVSP
jgi:hypothetical protein